VIGTEELRGGGGYGHSGIIEVRVFSQCAGGLSGVVWACEAKVGWSSKTGLFQNGNDDWFELEMKIL
jgi:hypothetical protein